MDDREEISMKAIVVREFGGADVLKYTDVQAPTMEDHQVKIRVHKTSVNFADIKSRYGNKGSSLPYIPGIDVAGTVEEVGGDVEGVKVGQRVIAFPDSGSYAEWAVANENLTFIIPDELDFATAAACPIVSFLSYKLLADIGRVEKGDRVLIHAAAGGVGTTAIQLAKVLGASQVIGTVGSDRKKETALEAGVDHVISYEDGNFANDVNKLTNEEGVDVILDSIAGWVTEQSLDCLAPYGRLVHFGNSSGEVGNVATKDLHASCRSILGFSLGTTRKKRPYLLKEVADQVFTYLADRRLDIKIGREFALEEAALAHEWIESRQSVGKVLLNVR